MTRSIAGRPITELVGRITKHGTLVAHVKFADDPKDAAPTVISRDSGGTWRTHTEDGPSARVQV